MYGGTASPNPDYLQEVQNVSGTVNVKVQNKNLCTNATKQDNNNLRFYIDKANIEKTFTLSFTPNVALSGNSLYLLIDGASVGNIAYITATANTKINQSITLSTSNYESVKNAQEVYFLLYKNNAGFTVPTDAQVENGSVATSYVPYEEQTATLTLPAGMELCKIGDYQDSFVRRNGVWYENKVIGKSIFDGSSDEQWLYEQLGGQKNNFYISMPNSLGGRYTPLLMNIGMYSADLANDYTAYISSGNAKYLNYRYQPLNNISDFKTFLSTTNLIVYYPLATPVLEEITDTTLIEQLETIYKLKSYNGQTNISQTNDSLPFILDISALKLE